MVRFFRQNKDYPPAIVAEMVKKGVDHDDEYVWDVGGNSMQTYSTKLVSDALCQSSLHVAWDRNTAY
ncbi:unnamed protein product [Brassica napus]|uniref:(rape) hypothetical protein n=1 Tax=Brassica napus TaxID=3708 RepID=A0A817BJE4_BRANA|nr:unnamed protein product [Brassica napus]